MISFMKLYNMSAETTKSGGRNRRAAELCSCPVWHSDIEDFIRCKEIDGTLNNMNISVGMTDKFMKAKEDGIPFSLHTPYDGSKVGEVNPGELWYDIATQAHKTGDPGMLFIDRMNEYNPLLNTVKIEATNPCGEQP